jgi:hypothetical protein
MRKIIYFHILAFTAFIFNACSPEQADIFASSSAERMNNAMIDNQTILTSAENGWAMQYFPTDAKPGYTFLMKFGLNKFVTIAGKNEFTIKNELQKDSSLYQLIADNGPVLTFNSYNNILHTFSNPQNPNGYGLEGDYEFMILKSSENELELKGKKRGVKIIMTKIPVTLSWSQYFDELDAMNATVLGNHAAPFTLTTPVADYIYSNGATRIFSVLKAGAEINSSTTASFVITRTGIRFSKMQEIDGKKFQNMKLSEDKSALVSVEDNTIKLLGPDSLAYYFWNDRNEWVVKPESLSAKLKATYDILVQSAIDKYKVDKVVLSVKYYAARSSFVVVLNLTGGKNKYIGYNDIGLSANAVNSIVSSEKGTGDRNGRTFYTNIVGLSQMIKWLCGSFTVSTNTAINPRDIKFIQQQDADVWFTLSRQ